MDSLIEQINKTPLNFWQANFWGILGSITGVAGFLVSWFNFKYNTPKIEIDKMYLITPDWVTKDWKNKTLADLKGSYLDFELEIVVRNRQGGAGSIDKPNLVIGIPYKFLWLFHKQEYIVVTPITEHSESEKESENITKIWTERHGRAFNLSGGEKIDEKLEYEINNADHIFEIVNNFERLKYYVEYSDNNGKYYKKLITKTYNESDRDE